MYGSTWRSDPGKAGAGTMLEHSIHDIDALEWLLGPAVSVSARSSTFHGNPGIEDTVVVGMELAGGAQVSLTSVWHQLLERPSLRRLEVICEHAFFTFEHDVMGPVTWTRPGEQGSLEGGELFSAVAERHDGRSPNQDAGFVDAVASGEPGPHPDFATALRAHEVVDGDLPRRRRAGGRAGGRSAGSDPPRQALGARGRRDRGAGAAAGTPSCATRSITSASTSAQSCARGPSTSRLYGAS